MPRLQNIKFSMRRTRFNTSLRIHRVLLPLFHRTLQGAVIAAVLMIFTMWMTNLPDISNVATSSLVPIPPEVPLHIVNESPFKDLRLPAERPVPYDTPITSTLLLTP